MEKVIFVQGPPGAGKSTLSRQTIAEAGMSRELTGGHALRFLPVGACVRSVLRGETPSRYTSRVQSEEYAIRTLHLPPPELVHGIVEEFLLASGAPGITLVDGYPRDMELIDMLHESESSERLQVLGNVVVDIEDNVSMKRQLARRSIDGHPVCTIEMATRRTAEYRDKTCHVVRTVRELWGGESIDGNPPLRVIAPLFTGALRSILSR